MFNFSHFKWLYTSRSRKLKKKKVILKNVYYASSQYATSQEIPRISRNPKVHYRTHKRPPPVSILGQPNPAHIHKSHLLEIRSNIIRPSTLRSPQWSPSLRFPHQDPTHPLSPIRATCPAHLILLDFITRTIFGEDATVCRYLFTAKLLYMFRVSQHPSSGVLKTVPAASGTGHTTCTGGCGYGF